MTSDSLSTPTYDLTIPSPTVSRWIKRRCQILECEIFYDVSATILEQTSLLLYQSYRKNCVYKDRLRSKLLAIVCVWISVKYHCDTNYSPLYDVTEHVTKEYTKTELLQSEAKVLKNLNWRVAVDFLTNY